MILLFWACSGEPTTAVPDNAPAVEEAAPAPEMAFEYRPEGVELVPSLIGLNQALAAAGLQDAAAARAAEIKLKPDVVVANVAAARTGAELGAFAVELGVTDPHLMAERVARIQSGLDAIQVDGPASVAAADLQTFLTTNPTGDEVLARVEAGRPIALDLIEAHAGEEKIPLLAAGAWLQAYALIAGAMEDVGDYSAAHALFHQQPVGDYFATYAATVGSSVIPGGVLEPLEMNLQTMKQLTSSDPMSAEEVKALREACEDLLGML